MKKTIAALMVTGLLMGTASAAYCAEAVEIGTKAGDTDYVVAVKNDTQEDIVSVKIRVDGAEYGDELITDALAAGGEGTLYCTPKELAPGASAPRYDIKVVFADGEVGVLHTVPFGDADELSIRLDAAEETEEETDETALEEAVEEATEAVEEETEAAEDAQEKQTVAAYIVFVSKSLGSEQNTKQRESDLMNIPAAPAAPAASDGGQTYSEPVYEDYSYDDYSYDSSQDYSYDSSQDYSYDASQDYSYDSSQDYSYDNYDYSNYQQPSYDQGGGQDDQCEIDGVFF